MSAIRDFGSKNPLYYLFRKGYGYSSSKKRVIAFWCMYVVAESVDMLLGPFLWSRIINVVTSEGITERSLEKLCAFLTLIVLQHFVFWSIHGPARLLERLHAFWVRVNYRRHLLKGVMMLPLEWHTCHHSGDTIDKVSKGTTALHEFSEDSFEIIYALVRLVGSYAMLVYFCHAAWWIALLMMVISAWITMRFDTVLIRQYHELNTIENKVSESVFDAISNIGTVIVVRVERLVFNAIMRKVEQPLELVKSNNRLNEWKWALTSFCCSIMTAIVLMVYFFEHVGAAKGVLVGDVYLLISYLEKISNLFFSFTSMYGGVVQRKAKLANSEKLSVDFRPESFSNHVLPHEWQSISVTNLTFSYHSEEGADLHLDNVSFECKRGEWIALVGPTGSGKSTFLSTMRGLYVPHKLILRVDGETIPGGFDGISRAISLAIQKPDVFATTIWENITLGADYPEAFVLRYTDMACFTDVIRRLPRGFESSIRERGVNLSGGEQQRLALARALLASHDKDIVLLDEPTSSLDALTQMRVYQNIFAGFHGRTIISTVHQLNLLPLFHRIYVFDKGKIVGSGTINELLASCPEFVTLYATAEQR